MSMMDTLFDEETIMESRIVTAERNAKFEDILNLMEKKGYSFHEALDIFVDPSEYWWYKSEYENYLKELDSPKEDFKISSYDKEFEAYLLSDENMQYINNTTNDTTDTNF